MNPTLFPSIIRSVSRLALAGWLGGSALAQEQFELLDLSISPQLKPMAGGDFSIEVPLLGDGPALLGGGDYTMETTITPLPPILVFGDAEVYITMSGGQAVVTWSAPGGGHVLESSATLGPTAQWSPVTPTPTEPRYTIDPAQGAPRFFRLRR